jgi:hypothetical protein
MLLMLLLVCSGKYLGGGRKGGFGWSAFEWLGAVGSGARSGARSGAESGAQSAATFTVVIISRSKIPMTILLPP